MPFNANIRRWYLMIIYVHKDVKHDTDVHRLYLNLRGENFTITNTSVPGLYQLTVTTQAGYSIKYKYPDGHTSRFDIHGIAKLNEVVLTYDVYEQDPPELKELHDEWMLPLYYVLGGEITKNTKSIREEYIIKIYVALPIKTLNREYAGPWEEVQEKETLIGSLKYNIPIGEKSDILETAYCGWKFRITEPT